jgi:hypothetical protein
MAKEKSHLDISKYLKKYFELKPQSKIDSNFRDICGNLVTALDVSKPLVIYLKATETYFGLLEKYPIFRERELSFPEGCFPELRNYTCSENAKEEQKKSFGESSIVHYVSLCKQKLEGR